MDAVQYVERTADINSGQNRIPFPCKSRIVYISNDDLLNQIRVVFDGYASQINGILIKAGESVSDIILPPGASIREIAVEGIGGKANFRALGV